MVRYKVYKIDENIIAETTAADYCKYVTCMKLYKFKFKKYFISYPALMLF